MIKMNKTRLLALLLLLSTPLLSTPCLGAPQDPWAELHQQAKKYLTSLIAINTAMPSPHELKAARFIYKEFNKHKIDWEIFIPVKGRANLLARLKGTDPSQKPLLLISHLDTVAPSEGWTFPPFQATEQNGRIYGLGATDAKNYTAIFLALFNWLADQPQSPKRDIIFLATSGEESGSEPGLRWLEDTYWSTINPGYALNEGGGIIRSEDGADIVFAEASTKMYMDVKITARGTETHSSVPTNDNAVYALSQALAKIADYDPPAKLTAVSRAFFQSILPLQDEDGQTTIRLLLEGNAANQQSAAQVMAQDPFFRTQLKDTLSPTLLSASSQEANSTSAEASALINIRLLPGSDPDELFEELKNLFKEDPSISLEIVERPQIPFPTPMDGTDALFASIKRTARKLWPGSITVPGLSPASGDNEFLRRLGVVTYGIGPEIDLLSPTTPHGADEFIQADDFFRQLQFTAGIVFDFAYGRDLIALPAEDAAESSTQNDLGNSSIQGDLYDQKNNKN